MNVKNRTLFIADNLDIMRGMDSETIDLIYLDPPFNSNRNYKAPIGSAAEGAEFKDIWTDEDIKHEWHGEIAAEHEELYQIIQASEAVYDKSMKIYLTAMAVRLFEMERILKPTGSIYLHCDPTASHYLKMVMDDLFGVKSFRNEIIWKRTTAHNDSAVYGGIHDTILYYSKGNSATHNEQYQPYSDEYLKRYRHTDENGKRFLDRDLTAGSLSGGGYQYEWNGITKIWRCPFTTMQEYHKSGKLYYTRNGTPRLKQFLDDMPGVPVQDVWIDIPPINSQAKERVGYPTQKPLALLNRIIKASSNEGDMVLDPFCGCATACVAAERLHRHWVGIDISPAAEDITKLRLTEEVDKASGLFNPITDVIVRKDAPERTDNAEEIALQKRVPRYQTHKPELFGRQQGKCNGCQYPFHFRNLTVDHKTPQSKGGTDHIENLQLLCAACNSTKGDRTQEELISRLKEQGVLK